MKPTPRVFPYPIALDCEWLMMPLVPYCDPEYPLSMGRRQALGTGPRGSCSPQPQSARAGARSASLASAQDSTVIQGSGRASVAPHLKEAGTMWDQIANLWKHDWKLQPGAGIERKTMVPIPPIIKKNPPTRVWDTYNAYRHRYPGYSACLDIRYPETWPELELGLVLRQDRLLNN